MNFKLIAWASILLLILNSLTLIFGFSTISQGSQLNSSPLLIVLSILVGIFSFVVLLGYLDLSKKIASKFLRTMTILAAILVIISTVTDILLMSPNLNLISILYLIVYGLILLFFGISLFKLKELFGKLAGALAILYIISGAGYITIIFTIVSIPILIAIGVLEVILFFRAATKYNSKQPLQRKPVKIIKVKKK